MMSYPPSEATLANTTRLPVSDAVKFNMADRLHHRDYGRGFIGYPKGRNRDRKLAN